MKKTLFTLLFAFTLSVSACSAAPTAPTESQESSTLVADLVNQSLTQSAPAATEATSITNSAVLTSEYENAASVEMQLILGSMKLDGTAQSITKEQANTLLPLWSSYSTLSQSMMPSMDAGQQGQSDPPAVNVEAQTQLAELTAQIQSAMAAEQIQAITSMQITQESAQTMMRELGLEIANDGQGMGGQMPQGEPPSGGELGEGQPPSGDQTLGTPPADAGPGRGGGIIQPQVLEAFIQFLEDRANS